MDDRHRRLSIHPGEEERLSYVGWELAGRIAFGDPFGFPHEVYYGPVPAMPAMPAISN